jgi:hypothetical protein
MVLKEWSKAWNLYTQTRKQLWKAVLFPRNARASWAVWATHLGLMLSSLGLIRAFTDLVRETAGSQSTAAYFGVFVCMVALKRGVSERALTKQFAMEYEIHGLAHASFLTRQMYLHYALFLRALREQRYSQAEVAQLSSLADIAKPPETPVLQFSQNPLFVYPMLLTVPLAVSCITTSVLWERGGAGAIFGISFMLLGLLVTWLSLWHDISNRPKYQHLTLQRFLQWAERDIDEDQSACEVE